MSVARNRSGKIHGSHHGPRIPARSLDEDLQGAKDALIAFDGFVPSSQPHHLESVLERPSAVQGQSRYSGWLLSLWAAVVRVVAGFRLGADR